MNGLNIGDGLTVESALSAEAVEFGGVNAYKITANSQGKIKISPSLIANKTKITFSVFMPETSSAKLGGLGEFSIRVKPKSLAGSGYITFDSASTDETRKIVFGEWKTYEIDVSSYGSECTEFSIILAKDNVMYLKDVTIV